MSSTLPHKKALLKVILLGDLSTGKTSLTKYYVHKNFDYQSTTATDFWTKEVMIDDHYVHMQIWDTAGQERYENSIPKSFYRDSNACIFVYDVSNPTSFKNLDKWKDAFLKNCNIEPNKFSFVLIGNKSDLKKAVKETDAQEWAKKNWNMPFFEASAKEGDNVETAFQVAGKNALGSVVDRPEISGTLGEFKSPPKKTGCCG